MHLIDKSSIVLAIVLLCQIASAQFSLEGFGSTGQIRELRTVNDGEGKQLSMAGGTATVLIEAKRGEPLGRAESVHQQLDGARLHDCYAFLEEKPSWGQSGSSLPPVRKGFWLIYRALLL